MLDNLNLDLAPTASVANKLIDKVSGFLSYRIGKESPENIAVNVFIEEVKKLNCDALTKAMLISCFWQDLFVGFGQIKIHNLANYIL